MNNFNVDIQLVDSKQVVADTTVDYMPFGVKTLKLQIRKIAGPAQKVWIRTKHFQARPRPVRDLWPRRRRRRPVGDLGRWRHHGILREV